MSRPYVRDQTARTERGRNTVAAPGGGSVPSRVSLFPARILLRARTAVREGRMKNERRWWQRGTPEGGLDSRIPAHSLLLWICFEESFWVAVRSVTDP